MTRSGNSKTVQQTPEVTFSMELRPVTPAQIEAGKRLFKRLVARVQSSTQTNNEQKNINTEM